MELVEFLLERIAEEEAEARCGVGWADRSTRWGRVLAECEAKRLIVEWATEHPTTCDDVHPQADVWHSDGHGPNAVARLLGLPYADHPDYREGWKP